MKWIYKIFFVLLMGVILTSCTNNNDQELKGFKLVGDNVQEYQIGVNELDDYEIVLEYDDGTYDIVTLDDPMVLGDQIITDEVGFYDFQVTIEGLSLTITFRVFETELDLKLLEVYEVARNSSTTLLNYSQWRNSLVRTGATITNCVINHNGNLIITYSDATSDDFGSVEGYIASSNTNIETYIVNFFNLQGFIVSSQLVEAGEDANDFDLVMPEGYTFTSWDTPLTNITSSINIHPLYSQNEYTLSFVPNNEEVISDELLYYNDSISLPIVSREGYQFLGWYTGETINDEQLYNDEKITSDMIIYARWQINTYTVSFNTFNGDIIDEQIVNHGDSINEYPVGVDGSKIFVGWYLDEHFESHYDKSSMITSNIILYAKFLDITYNLVMEENPYIIITDYNNDYDAIELPDMINGYPVWSIGNNAFKGATFSSLLLPNELKEIGMYAFADNPNLNSIVLPNTVYQIGTGIFENNTSLTDVTISTKISSIPYYAFRNCTSLQSIDIPDSVGIINDSAFENSGLKAITLPDNLKYIYNSVFANTFLEELILPSKLEIIGLFIIENVAGIKTIHIPQNVYSIAEGAFYNAPSLESITVDLLNPNFTAVNGVLYNKDITNLYMYPDNKSGTSFVVPTTVRTIKGYAVNNNPFLKTVSFADDIIIPIDRNFLELTSLTAYELYAGTYVENFSVVNGVLFNSNNTVLYRYPISKIETSYIVPNVVISIERYAFANQQYLVNVSLLNIKYIGSYAFYNCDNIVTLNMPTSLLVILERAFAEMDSLTTFNINNGLMQLDKAVWENSVNVTSISLPSSLTMLHVEALIGLPALETLTIDPSNTVYQIDSDMVVYTQNWTNLIIYHENIQITNYEVASSVTTISAEFGANEYLESIYIHENVERLMSNTFIECPNLDLITFKYDTYATNVSTDIFNPNNPDLRISVPNVTYISYISQDPFSDFIDQIYGE